MPPDRELVHARERYKTFPPRWQHIQVPLSSRGAALAALTLYAPCKPRGLWGQRLMWAAVAVLGPNALPGPPATLESPVEEDLWLELEGLLEREIGEFDSMAIYRRPQASRSGLAILLVHGRVPVAFVKLRQDAPQTLKREMQAIQSVVASEPQSFSVPEPIAWGGCRGWRYLALAPLPPWPHRPPKSPPIHAIAEEIQHGLDALPKPPKTPVHWRPMHGDFTPWNLRLIPGRVLFLLDWEDAGWGPPGADVVRYEASRATLRDTRAKAIPYEEAITFWLDNIRPPASSDPDFLFTQRHIEALKSMSPSGATVDRPNEE